MEATVDVRIFLSSILRIHIWRLLPFTFTFTLMSHLCNMEHVARKIDRYLRRARQPLQPMQIAEKVNLFHCNVRSTVTVFLSFIAVSNFTRVWTTPMIFRACTYGQILSNQHLPFLPFRSFSNNNFSRRKGKIVCARCARPRLRIGAFFPPPLYPHSHSLCPDCIHR